jgi:hypothetical protein
MKTKVKKIKPKPRESVITVRDPELVADVAAVQKQSRLPSLASAAAMLVGEALAARKAGGK